jgi:hypothetical protein
VAAGHRVLTGLGLGALALAAAAPAAALPARAQSSAITFSTPAVMSPVETVGEPTIVHSPAADNTVYASGPWGTGTQRSIWYASADGGETFRLVNQCAPQSGMANAECQAPTAASGSANPPGGGDTDQRVDSNGRDYFVDLWALACDRVATTTDGGATARQNAYGCNSPTANPSSRPDGSDRQWLAVFDPKLTGVKSSAPDAALAPLTYMEYNNLQTTQGGCSYWVKSTDGISYTPANNDKGNYGCDGYPSVDQVTGDVLEASRGQLNIGIPDATGNLTFLDDAGGNALGTQLIRYAPDAISGDTLFAVSSIDTGRNLHVTWADGGTRQVYTTVAAAATHWSQFATPVQVSAAPSNTNVFPWVVAGGPGRSDSVWYGTNSTADPSSNSGQQWYTYMSQAVWPVDASGAVTLQAPSLQMVQVSPHPSHYNSICLQGTGCITSQGDRNLADFFSVTIDHSGAAEVEYDDTTNGLEQQGFTPANGLADHAGAPVVTIARQDSGLGLFGTPVSPRPGEVTSAPTSGNAHKAGNALYPVIGGTNVAGLDLTGTNLSLSPDASTLTVTMNVADLTASGISGAFTSVPGAGFLQYVTRWVMCPANSNTETNSCTIYYAMAEIAPAAAGGSAPVQYSGGKAQSIDLCSVSACDPHAVVYPEAASASLPAAVGSPESGSLNCPATVSAATPCTLTISVKTADIGGVTASSLLEQVGTYSFAAARPQASTTNAMAEADALPLEVDGACCFNFQASSLSVAVPEAPTAAGLVALGLALLGGGEVLRRRRRRAAVAAGPAQE